MNRLSFLLVLWVAFAWLGLAGATYGQVENSASKRKSPPAGWKKAEWPQKKKVLLEHYAPTAKELELIEQAVPKSARANPEKPRRILSFYRCDFPHTSIATGIAAFEKIGKATRAYSIDSTDDPAAFSKENLAKYDAIMLNNAVRFDQFLNDDQRQAFLDFVESGKGMIGIHGATSACTEWPEGAQVAGAVFHCHPWKSGGTWAGQVESPDHELNEAWKDKETWFKDEIYIYRGGSFSRDRSRVLLSMDMTKQRNYVGTHLDQKTSQHIKPDGDFPVAWIHRYGNGKVFCTNLGHNHATYWNPVVLQHYLDGIQFALGDLSADETPSAQIKQEDLVIARAEAKKIIFLAGKKSHSSGEHEFRAGCMLLAKRLNAQSDLPIQAEVISEWPEDDSVLDGASAIIIYCDSDSVHREHYFRLMELSRKGSGLFFMHYGVHPKKAESGRDYYMPTVGGFMETGFSVNPHWVADLQASSEHPVFRGCEKPVKVFDEFYYNMRFDEKAVPLATAVPVEEKLIKTNLWNDNGPAGFGKKQTLAWGFTQANGTRGGGFTGGHFHRNWANDEFRKIILNSIVWVAGMEVPAKGIESAKVSEEEINSNLDEKRGGVKKISLPLKDAMEYYREKSEARKSRGARKKKGAGRKKADPQPKTEPKKLELQKK